MLSKVNNFMLIGDLNAEPTEAVVSDFCEIFNLKHLIKDKTWFINPTKPTCIDGQNVFRMISSLRHRGIRLSHRRSKTYSGLFVK